MELDPPEPEDLEVLEAVGWDPTSTDEVLLRTGRALGVAAASLLRLEGRGYIAGDNGWWQRVECVKGQG